MNYLIQRGKLRQQAINVVDGLPELLSDITREVLRCQPTKECLCQFIIDYLHSVIVTREKAMVAKSILGRALRQVDSIISDLCVCDVGKEKSELMAQVMEECFRNFLEKRRCEMRRGKEIVKFADIDMLEELIKKCNFTDVELDASRPAIENAYHRFVDAYMAAAKDSKGTEILYQYFRDRELKRIEEIMKNHAAITIQAAWRGYIVRRTMEQHVCVCTCMMDDDDEILRKTRDRAARIIQRFFRSVLDRKPVQPLGEPCEEKETPSSREYTPPEVPAVPSATPSKETAPPIIEKGSEEAISEVEEEPAAPPAAAPPGEAAPAEAAPAEAAPAEAAPAEAPPAEAPPAEAPPAEAPPAEAAAAPAPEAPAEAPPPAAEEAPPAE